MSSLRSKVRSLEKRIKRLEAEAPPVLTAILELDRITSDYVKFRNGLVDFSREMLGKTKGK